LAAPASQPDPVDEHLRLLARALIDTAVQVNDQALAAGLPPPKPANRADGQVALDLGGASRYPPTSRDCGPAQRRRRSRSERRRSPSERQQASDD
jgi:hypothetical protein